MKNKYIFGAVLLVVAGSLVFTHCDNKEQKVSTNNGGINNTRQSVVNDKLPELNQSLAVLNNSEFIETQFQNTTTSNKVAIDTIERGIFIHQPTIKYSYKDYGYVEGIVVGRDSKNAEIFVGNKRVENNNGRFAVIIERPENQNENIWSTNVLARFKDGEEIGSIATYTDNDLTYEAPTETKEITKGVATDLTLKSATLKITKGAVKQTKAISVSELRKEDLALTGSEMTNVTAEAEGYRFLPDGTKFEKELVIAIGYNRDRIPSGYTPEDIFTYYYDETLRSWQQLERDSINEELQIIYSRTNHFTDYINGVLKTPESSDVMAYTPTSIKDLEAVQPLNGITTIAPPQANNKGTANLTYPINVPAGRRGMQPDLNITYNSSGGSGLLGLGWDLSMSTISVETRWGVPLYDPILESETYLLDGETLVTSDDDGYTLNKPNYQRKWDTDSIKRTENEVGGYDSKTKQFYPRVEGAFRKILRHGTNPTSYWWEVIGKDGTKYFYSSLGDSLDKESAFISNIGDYSNENKSIAKWHLRKVIDVYGNTINYHYNLYTADGDHQLVLDYITYTGYEGTVYNEDYGYDEPVNEEGLYKIIFKTGIKRDKTSSYRYGFKETNSILLDKIQVLYNTDTLKEYYFGYKPGGFDKTLLCNVVEVDSTTRFFYGFNVNNFGSFSQLDMYNRCIDLSISGDIMNPILLYSFDYNLLPEKILEDNARTVQYEGNNNRNIGYWLLPVFDRSNFSGSESFSWNTGGGAGGGIGYRVWTKVLSLGGNYVYTKDESSGTSTMADLNGDGYPDKLIKDGNKLKYRLRIVTNDNEIKFGDLKTIQDSPLKNFQHSESSTDNWGVEGQLIGSIGYAANWSDTRSSTLTYMTDANADGLVDIIHNGKVYLNQCYVNSNETITFLDITDMDSILVGGSCGEEYYYNEETVDTSLFSSGWYDVDTIICDGDSTWFTLEPTYSTVSNYDTIKGFKYDVVQFSDGTIDTVWFLCSISPYANCNEIIFQGNYYNYPGASEYAYLPYNGNNAYYCSRPNSHKDSMCFRIIGGGDKDLITPSGYTTTMQMDTVWHTGGDSCWTDTRSFYYQYPERFAPAIDLVRVWIAPYKGTVDISGTASLSEDFQEFRQMTNILDGVGVCIQKAGEDTLKYWTLTPSESTRDMNISNLSVDKGDKIFFRMTSMTRRDYDKIVWNPSVRYIEAYNKQNIAYAQARLNDVDANGDSIFRFNYANDYSLSQEQKTGANFDSKFRVNATITSNGKPLKEDLKFTIKKEYEIKDSVYLKYQYDFWDCPHHSYTKDTITYQRHDYGFATYTFAKGDIVSIDIDTFVNMKQEYSFLSNTNLPTEDDDCFTCTSTKYIGNESIFFELTSANGGQQKWADINANITVAIVESFDYNYENESLFKFDTLNGNNDTVYNFVYHPSVNKIAYDYMEIPDSAFIPTSDINGFRIIKSPDLSTMTIKGSTGVILPTSISGNTYTYSDTLKQGHKYYIDYYTNNAANINTATAQLRNSNNALIATINAGVYTNYATAFNKFGPLYRNWGQFGYRGNAGTANVLIDTSLLYLNEHLVSMDSSDVSNSPVILSSDSPEALASSGNIYNPLLDNFFFMNADPVNSCWKGYGNIIYVSKEYVGHTKVSTANDTVVDNTISPLAAAVPGAKMVAIKKHTFTKGRAQNGSISIPGLYSEGVNKSKGTTRVLGDFMDMNGDRYPDILSETQIQYSKQRGGLSKLTIAFNGMVDSSANEAEGGNVGGTFIQPKFELGSDVKKGKTIVAGAFGGSIGGSSSTNTTYTTLLDINGDGLPDKLYQNGAVSFNRGYGFVGGSYGLNGNLRRSFSQSFNISADGSLSNELNLPNSYFNTLGTSISGGLGYSFNKNTTTYALSDMNGDGLPDIVISSDAGCSVKFNTGSGFTTEAVQMGGAFDYSKTHNIDASVAFTAGVTIGFVLPIKIYGNVKGGMVFSETMTEAQWIDMNNDGCPDLVYRDGGSIKVRYSQIGKTNLLNSVSTVWGSEYKIDYALSESSKDCPQRYWNMSSLRIYDGFKGDGEDTMRTDFVYKHRKYDRFEREDYGYDTIQIKEYNNNLVERIKTLAYHTDNYKFKGIMKYDLVTNRNNNKYVENIYKYQSAEITSGAIVPDSAAHCWGSTYPVITQQRTLYYEGGNTAQVITKQEYDYTIYGNVSVFTDYGNEAISGDEITANISYDTIHEIIDYNFNTNIPIYKYIVNLPREVNITANGNMLRSRTATYTDIGGLSSLTLANNNSTSVYNYTYDNYGNIDSVVMPANANGQRMKIYYHYEDVLHTYPDTVSNALGYYSTAEYDYRWGKPKWTSDIAGNRMEYTYDTKGRTKTIRAPKEIFNNKPYTIKYEYWDLAEYKCPKFTSYETSMKKLNTPFAKTTHYDPEHDTNILTIAFADGLGRIVQVKKTAEINGSEKFITSGWVSYDGLGRAVKQYAPMVDTIMIPYAPTATHNSLWCGGSNRTHYYMFGGISNRYFIETYYIAYKTPSGITPTQTTYDILDRPLEIINPDNTSISNGYGLSADNTGVRFLTKTTDPNGNTFQIYTDHRQLKTMIKDPLQHTTSFVYDALGQLTQSRDPEGHPTTYDYDMFGKLLHRHHPSMGATAYEYDPAGNMIRQTMSNGEFIDYLYDYNRPTEIRYSDRYWNNVRYEYGSATDTINNNRGRLIKQQDATGVQTFVYGNMGELIENHHTHIVPNSDLFTLHTYWQYDSWNRVKEITYPDSEVLTYSYNRGGLLKSVGSNKNGQQTFLVKNIEYDQYEQRRQVMYGNDVRITYYYDPLMRRMTDMASENMNNGITIQKNIYKYDPAGNIIQIIGAGQDNFQQDYKYDNKYQLVHAQGYWNRGQVSYALDMDYSPAGRILHKNAGGTGLTNNGTYFFHSDNVYNYNYSRNPYAIEDIHDNATGVVHQFRWDSKGNMINHHSRNKRYFCWTEDNRLQATQDGRTPAYYGYDASGERNLKLTGRIANVWLNGGYVDVPILQNATLYSSALVTINDRGYTKHYFEEGKRIASAIGGGGLFNTQTTVAVIELPYHEQQERQIEGIEYSFVKCLPSPIVNIKNYDMNKYVIDPNTQINNHIEPYFYYLTDHLGSSSYITNDAGQVTQTLAYFPLFGEDWVNMTLNRPQYETPYKFNGKEKI